MKIKPTIKQWVEGKTILLDWIEIRSIGDNYKDNCQNYYEICNTVIENVEEVIDGETVVTQTVKHTPYITGNIAIDGEDYTNWDNSNEQAYEIVCKKLGLEII